MAKRGAKAEQEQQPEAEQEQEQEATVPSPYAGRSLCAFPVPRVGAHRFLESILNYRSPDNGRAKLRVTECVTVLRNSGSRFAIFNMEGNADAEAVTPYLRALFAYAAAQEETEQPRVPGLGGDPGASWAIEMSDDEEPGPHNTAAEVTAEAKVRDWLQDGGSGSSADAEAQRLWSYLARIRVCQTQYRGRKPTPEELKEQGPKPIAGILAQPLRIRLSPLSIADLAACGGMLPADHIAAAKAEKDKAAGTDGAVAPAEDPTAAAEVPAQEEGKAEGGEDDDGYASFFGKKRRRQPDDPPQTEAKPTPRKEAAVPASTDASARGGGGGNKKKKLQVSSDCCKKCGSSEHFTRNCPG